MRFELKTENVSYTKSFSYVLGLFFILTLVIILCDISLKLGIISRHYHIKYNCSLLSIEKSTIHFKKLSKLSNLKTKQSIWEFCREVVK